jgi:preprotein translocase subunit YajC
MADANNSLFPADGEADLEKIENENYLAAMKKYHKRMRENKKNHSGFRKGDQVMVLRGINDKKQEVNEIEGEIIDPPGTESEKTYWVRLDNGNTAQCDYSMIRRRGQENA